MELQESQHDFERAGVALFAVSYDPVHVLARFAARHGITYSLLSDEGSRVIRSLGLLNRHVEEQAAYYGKVVEEHQRGVPYPGTFVLDEAGVILEKRFEQSYRVRPQAVAFLEGSLAAASTRPGARASARTDEVAVSAWIGQTTYRPYQQLALRLDLVIAPGLHVYGYPVPDGYTPLSVDIDPLESLEVGPPEWPVPHEFRLAGLDERFLVHEGSIRGVVPLVLRRNLGRTALTARLRYQACSADECHPPNAVALRLTLEGLDNVSD